MMCLVTLILILILILSQDLWIKKLLIWVHLLHRRI